MKLLLFCFINLLLTVNALAQDLSRDEVLEKLKENSQNMQDASFLITGRLIDTDNQEFTLEIQVQTIPSENLVRLDFFQPDAVADNFIILDNDGVYNYNFLTNQLSIYNLGDAAAFGGIFPEGANGTYEFTLNVTELFSGWDIELVGFENGLYHLKFNNTETINIRLKHVDVYVDQDLGLPTAMAFYNADDILTADIQINDYVINQGIDTDEVRYFDETAEILDER
jgi:outer membrane lipoprotein-sorting protein